MRMIIFGVLCAAGALVAFGSASSASSSAFDQRLVLRFVQGTRYERTETVTHNIVYDMSQTLHRLTGSRSNPVTILETRERTLELLDGSGRVKISEKNTRKYVDNKDKSVMARTSTYDGKLHSDGSLDPAIAQLEDAGDGALDQLPVKTLTAGQTWTFSRPIKVERSLGYGSMTYTDKLLRFENRNGKWYAVIGVTGAGRVDVASDLQAKGFHTADMTLTGNADFDVTDGMPGEQHYTGHVEWRTRVMFTTIGVIFNDTYTADPWTKAGAATAH